MNVTAEVRNTASDPFENGVFYGWSDNRTDVKLSGLKEVAEFLVDEGGYGESDSCIILDSNHGFLCRTIGYFLDKVSVPAFRSRLMEHLVPLQLDYEADLFG